MSQIGMESQGEADKKNDGTSALISAINEPGVMKLIHPNEGRGQLWLFRFSRAFVLRREQIGFSIIWGEFGDSVDG
jgi:hypothetical protein